MEKLVGDENMKIAIGTKNKAKIAAVETVLTYYFDTVQFESIEVASGVAEQPMSDAETRQGAMNRAKHALQATDAQMAFGLEGGVYEMDGQMYCCNWGAVALADGTVIASSGASFVLPQVVADRIRIGEELGPVMDDFTQTLDIRQHAGAIGIFTNGLVDRKEMFQHIVTLLVGQVEYLQQQ